MKCLSKLLISGERAIASREGYTVWKFKKFSRHTEFFREITLGKSRPSKNYQIAKLTILTNFVKPFDRKVKIGFTEKF